MPPAADASPSRRHPTAAPALAAIFLATIFLTTVPAVAQFQPPAPAALPVGTDLERRLAAARAIADANARAALARATAPMATSPSPPTSQSTPPSPAPVAASMPALAAVPVVATPPATKPLPTLDPTTYRPPYTEEVGGTGRHLTATVRYPNGQIDTAVPGHHLRDGARVITVTRGSVVLDVAGTSFTLRPLTALPPPSPAPAQSRRPRP